MINGKISIKISKMSNKAGNDLRIFTEIDGKIYAVIVNEKNLVELGPTDGAYELGEPFAEIGYKDSASLFTNLTDELIDRGYVPSRNEVQRLEKENERLWNVLEAQARRQTTF